MKEECKFCIYDYEECFFNQICQKENPSFERVKHPICAFSLYFEGDEDKCDTSKCDFEHRQCSQACKIPSNKVFEAIHFITLEKEVSESGELEREIECMIGCNEKNHAISIAKIFYSEGKVCFAEPIHESVIGKCTCKQLKNSGFILRKENNYDSISC